MWITVQEIIDAARKNGFKWIQGWHDGYVDYDDSKQPYVINAACILGQVSYNLGVHGDALASKLDTLGEIEVSSIAGKRRLGTAIIRYNDNRAEDYADALRYLEEVLSPHAAKKLLLAKFNHEKNNVKLKRVNE